MQNNIKNKNFSFFKVAGRTTRLFYKVLSAWKIMFIYGGILTALSVLFGRYEYSCHGSKTNFWCHSGPQFVQSYSGQVMYLTLFFLLVAYLTFSFLCDVHNTVFKNDVFKTMGIIKPNKDKLKQMGFLFGSFIGFILLFVVAWLIVLKPANPDWRIEFIYFTSAFVCAFTPLVFLRLSAVIGYYLQNLHLPSFDMLFKQTSGRSYVGVVGFIFCLMLVCTVNLRLMGEFNSLNSGDNFFVMAVGLEFVDYVIKLYLITLFMCFFRAEYEVMEMAVISQNGQSKTEDIKPAISVSKKVFAVADKHKNNSKTNKNTPTKKVAKKKTSTTPKKSKSSRKKSAD